MTWSEFFAHPYFRPANLAKPTSFLSENETRPATPVQSPQPSTPVKTTPATNPARVPATPTKVAPTPTKEQREQREMRVKRLAEISHNAHVLDVVLLGSHFNALKL